MEGFLGGHIGEGAIANDVETAKCQLSNDTIQACEESLSIGSERIVKIARYNQTLNINRHFPCQAAQ